MIITEATKDLQLLSNIGDLAIAGKALTGTAIDHCAVKVKLGETSILDETLYADVDGTVYLRDVKSLLRPYIEPATIASFTITVGTVEYDLDVMYCLAEIERLSDDTMLSNLRGNFPTTANRKKISMSTQELLPIFGNYPYIQQQNLSLRVLCSISGGNPEEKTITIVSRSASGQVISYVDVSPSRVQTFLATQLSVSASSIRIYGYTVSYDYFDYHPTFVYSVVQSDLPLTLCYQNAFGAWETQPVAGSKVVMRDYSITNAKITGRLQRIDSRLTKAHSFTMPLVTDVDNEIMESIIASQSLKMYEDGKWREITITGYTHETDDHLAAQNSISFTYEWQENEHRIQMQKSQPDGTLSTFKDYVADGLVLQLDCESGQTSTKWSTIATKWLDSQTFTGTFTKTSSGAITIGSDVTLGEALGAIGSDYTIEACVVASAKNLGSIVDTNGKGMSADGSYLYSTTKKASNPITAGECITLTVTKDGIYANGAAITASAATKTAAQNFTISAGTYCSIRVYRRSLSASEIAANAFIDKVRFRVPSNAFILGNGDPFVLGDGGFFLLDS